MPWTYQGKIIESLPEDCEGFVYLITNTTNGKQYVGKKLAKFKKTRPHQGWINKRRARLNQTGVTIGVRGLLAGRCGTTRRRQIHKANTVHLQQQRRNELSGGREQLKASIRIRHVLQWLINVRVVVQSQEKK